MAIAAAIITLAAAAYSARQQQKARKAQQEANDRAEKKAEAERQRQRQKALAQAAKIRSRIAAEQVTAGIGGQSTAVTQSQGAVTSQLNSNLGFLSQIQQLDAQRFQAQQDAISYQGKAQTGQAVGSAAAGVAGSFA